MPILNFCHEVLVSSSAELQQLQQEVSVGGGSPEKQKAIEAAASRKEGGMYILGSLRCQLNDPQVPGGWGSGVWGLGSRV